MSTQVTKVSPASLVSAPHSGPGPVERILDAMPWWALPATVVTVLGLFGLYSIWTAFLSGGINQSGSYLSPFYSPTIWKTAHPRLRRLTTKTCSATGGLRTPA